LTSEARAATASVFTTRDRRRLAESVCGLTALCTDDFLDISALKQNDVCAQYYSTFALRVNMEN
jgi:hypothetical protein